MKNNGSTPLAFVKTEDAVTWILKQLGKKMRVATPLGLGKPNHLLNLLYDRVKADASLHLTLYTALSLSVPKASGLAANFLSPFAKRHWGDRYPHLEYLVDGARGTPPFPSNVEVHEFYFQAGAHLSNPLFQENYQSINYTHVAKCIFEAEVQIIVQLIAKRESEEGVRYSLSCNPDLTLDVVDRFKAQGIPFLVLGVVHPDLPFLGGEAEVDGKFFAAVLDDHSRSQVLFALPRTPIDPADHAIGFFASQLIPDDGTLQIGIGSLSDAVVHSLLHRHQHNVLYRDLVDFCWKGKEKSAPFRLELGPFEKGLYGLSEMINDGFMHLRNAGILKREILDELTGRKTYLHGAFYLGSKVFYEWLRTIKGEDYAGLRMSRISKINDLYDPNEILLRQQRINARFLNTCMQVTLLGGAASETLENGKVVSGVGGQYNFVSMALELEGAHSILMLRSTREQGGVRASNLVWSHGQLTIPRHLRDQVITEYGIANIRNKTDQDTICAILNICDSEFQQGLLEIAKKSGKVRADYQIPEWARHNHPARVAELMAAGRKQSMFSPFPFGSDFTETEERLVVALGELKMLKPLQIFKLLWRSCSLESPLPFHAELARMGLADAKKLKDRLYRRLITQLLHEKENEHHGL